MLLARYYEFQNVIELSLANNDIPQSAGEGATILINRAMTSMDAAERMRLDHDIIEQFMHLYIRHSPIIDVERQRFIQLATDLDNQYAARTGNHLSLDQFNRKLNIGYRHWVQDELDWLSEYIRIALQN